MNDDDRPGEARYDPAPGAWVLSSFADVSAALRDSRLSAAGASGDRGAAHVDVREAVASASTPARLVAWRAEIASSALALAECLPAGVPVDLVGAFAQPWSIAVAIRAAGAPPEDAERLDTLAREVFLAAAHATDAGFPPGAKAAVAELANLLKAAGGLADVQTFVALSQTLPCALAGAWHSLCRHPEEAERLRSEPDLMAGAVAELLRHSGPSRAVFRRAHAATSIGRAEIDAGNRVILMLSAANHDPLRFPEPERLDLRRDASGHVAFGGGAHSCPGAPLIRMAVAVATGALLGSSIAIEPAGEAEWIGGFAIRGPASLPVVLRRGPDYSDDRTRQLSRELSPFPLARERETAMAGLAVDEAGPVREGEALDVRALSDYLSSHLAGGIGPGSISVEQFPHGHSNLTYLVRLDGRELVLRRPPFGNRVKTAHDMGREYRILSRLCRVYEPAPCPVLACEDESILGAPFYLMERRRGIILRRPPSDPRITPDVVRRLCDSLVEGLARLHALDYRAAGLADLGKPEGYVQRQVTGWSRRYRDARTDDVPALERASEWLDANRPGESGSALIHNDYKFDNLVLDPEDPTRIVAVLDWEMATIGDPLMDLGTTLGYWIQPDDPEPIRRFLAGPTAMEGSLARRELADRYAQEAGRPLPDLLFYYVCGLFKIAVIAQQIYARYVRGATTDPRFAPLGAVVAALGESAVRAIDSGRY